ncbi:DEAD (Asp-Glu-Ala-Asp) box polypeptide 20 [Mactra antiquata]
MLTCVLIIIKMSKVAHNFHEKSRTGDVIISESVNFNNLLLSQPVLNGLKNAGFIRPSPIQLKAIPLGRCGLDLIVQAKSGTGKTCVFSVIALESIVTETASTQVLVLAPTREIAVQIWDVICSIGSAINGLQCHTFIGGMPLHEDRMKLRKCHIAVGSPGRIKQLIECGALHTDSIRLFILDEADKLLEDSFQDQINWIYSSLSENKQMLALSATYPEYLAQHLIAYMRNPTFLRLNISDPALLGIRQYYQTVTYHPMSHIVFEEKTKVLFNILSSISFQQCLVFSNLQSRAQTLADLLTKSGWPTSCIAGRLDQTERNNAMAQLKTYKCRVLISTDLTSRGIDADKVNLVVNMDLPKDHETYLHRIGRAGRFGSFGIAISLISEGQERVNMNSIEKKCNTQINLIPDPIPHDLAKPDCPILLDDVVSSEVICTEKNKHSLANNDSREHEARSDSKMIVNRDTGVMSLESSSNIERFPYQLSHDNEADVDNCKVNSCHKSGDEASSTLIEVDNKTIKYNETNDTNVRNGDCIINQSTVSNDNNCEVMNNEAVTPSNTSSKSRLKPLSQEVTKLKSALCSYDIGNDRIEADIDTHVRTPPKMIESYRSPELVETNHSKSRTECVYRSENNMEPDMEIPFEMLRNLKISDVIKQNVGYRTLSKCHSYTEAIESMKVYKARQQVVSEDRADISDALKTLCTVNSPSNEHIETDTLRQAISAIRNVHECSLSQNRLRQEPGRNSLGDDFSSNLDRLASGDHSMEDEEQDKIEQARDAEVTVHNETTCISYPASDVVSVQLESSVEIKQESELNKNFALDGGDRDELNSIPDSKSVTTQVHDFKTKKKRFGYLGNFAIGHLLEQERGKDLNQTNTEQINEVDHEKPTASSISNPDPDIVGNKHDVANNVDDLVVEDCKSNYSEDSIEDMLDIKRYSRGSTKPEEKYVMLKEASNIKGEEMHGSHHSNLLTSFNFVPRNENGDSAVSKSVLKDFNERSAVNSVELEADNDENKSDSEDDSSSEISDTDVSSEDSLENVGVDKNDRKVRNRICSDSSESHSGTQRSDNSDSRTHDSGVYSRPSYHDYWYQCYNVWFSSNISQHPGWNPYNQNYHPFFNGNQSSYPSCNYGCQLPYHGYLATNRPYPSYVNPYSQSVYSQPSTWSYPLHGQNASRNSPRSTVPSQPSTNKSVSSSANCMTDIYQFQNDYIKQMCKFNKSEKPREKLNEQ